MGHTYAAAVTLVRMINTCYLCIDSIRQYGLQYQYIECSERKRAATQERFAFTEESVDFGRWCFEYTAAERTVLLTRNPAGVSTSALSSVLNSSNTAVDVAIL